MAAQQKLAETRIYIRISSSIDNFRQKLLNKTKLTEWSWSSRQHPALFVGMYHWGDYLRLLTHKGHRTVFWCGSDILNLKKSIFKHIIRRLDIIHICENEIEQTMLTTMGIFAGLRPAFFGDISDFTQITFQPSTNPHVFLCVHKGREKEYGVDLIKQIAPQLTNITFHIYGIAGQKRGNLIYHGKVPDKIFNEEIKKYHAALRLNEVDGFAEILAKSVLLGQWPISRIWYPYITHYEETWQLIMHLKQLARKDKPNFAARNYWYPKLKTLI